MKLNDALADVIVNAIGTAGAPLLARIIAIEQHLGLRPPKIDVPKMIVPTEFLDTVSTTSAPKLKLRTWSPAVIFQAGDRVLYGGEGFECTRAQAGVAPDDPAGADCWRRLV
jgi:hypothetical protein